MFKWIGGMVSAILAGLAVWWLTSPDGPFGTHQTVIVDPPDPAPVISVVNTANVTQPNINRNGGDFVKAEVRLINDGNRTAQGCTFHVMDGQSERFSLRVGEEKRVIARSRTRVTQEGFLSLSMKVKCDGYSRSVPPATITVLDLRGNNSSGTTATGAVTAQ